MSAKTLGPAALLTVCLLFSEGCRPAENVTPEPERFPVSGTVRLDGKPLDTGWIYFKANGTPDDRVEIVNGRYEGQVQAGERRVEIFSTRQIKVTDGGMESIVEVNDVPDDYNVNSKLTVTAKSDANSFDFDLKGKKPGNK